MCQEVVEFARCPECDAPFMLDCRHEPVHIPLDLHIERALRAGWYCARSDRHAEWWCPRHAWKPKQDTMKAEQKAAAAAAKKAAKAPAPDPLNFAF